MIWIEKEFGFSVGTPESLTTVGDVVLAASGKGISAIESALQERQRRLDRGSHRQRAQRSRRATRSRRCFSSQASRRAGQVILADQASGEVTYRRLVLGLLLMVPKIRELPGRYVGIMLPASVGAGLFYLAALFAGKTPVMINWTTGSRNLVHALDLLGVERVLTAKALVTKLEGMGIDLSALAGRFVLAEDLRASFTTGQKLSALVRSHLSWRALRGVTPTDEAVVLFTSGSESLPKAVPLTHANILTNVRDTFAAVELLDRDVLIGMLPPFHSFGITVTTILPLCSGFRTVYHPNPTEAAVLARVIAGYGVTVLVGTPTFLNGIVRAAQPGQLRLAAPRGDRRREVLGGRVPGAQPRVPERDDPRGLRHHGMLADRVGDPDGEVDSRHHRKAAGLGGVRRARPREPRAGRARRVGHALRSRAEHLRRVSPLQRRVAVLRVGREAVVPDRRPGPAGRRRLADVRRAPQALRQARRGDDLAARRSRRCCCRTSRPRPTKGRRSRWRPWGRRRARRSCSSRCRPTTRDEVNRIVREAGLSALYNVRQVIQVDSIPVLGTGKTDYRGLKEACLARQAAVGSKQ